MKRTVPRTWAAGAIAIALGAGLGCGPSGPHGTGGGGGAGAGGGSAAWQTIYEGTELGGVILSVWGTGPKDVFAVGGPLGNGGDAVAWHWNGADWKSLSPGGTDSFWWVTGTGPNDVWMSGENGRITHWDGSSFQEQPRTTTATVWGVWAVSPTDVWAVAGTPGGGTAAPNDLVLHWDGSAWAADPLPGMPLGRSLNKIWGTSSSDLYAVGELGTVWHRKGQTWMLESDPPVATSNLLTVYGCSATDVYAVGGSDVIHSDGSGTWTPVTEVMLTNSVNGVACGAPGEVVLVGFGGLKQRLEGGTWQNDFAVEPYGDLHGSWAEGMGSFWAVGGDFITKATAGKARKAIIARFGEGTIPPPTP